MHSADQPAPAPTFYRRPLPRAVELSQTLLGSLPLGVPFLKPWGQGSAASSLRPDFCSALPRYQQLQFFYSFPEARTTPPHKSKPQGRAGGFPSFPPTSTTPSLSSQLCFLEFQLIVLRGGGGEPGNTNLLYNTKLCFPPNPHLFLFLVPFSPLNGWRHIS